MEGVQLQNDLQVVCSSIQSIAQRLVSTTQDVKDDPIIKVVQHADVPRLREIGTPGDAHPIDNVIEEAFTVFDQRMRVNHPRFLGLIPSPTSPYAWLGDCLASAFNALGASKLQASGPVVVEKTLIEWLASRAGFPDTAGGVFVSGGSMANLMGMALARDHRIPRGKESLGVAYVSDQTHYSVAKALRLLGFSQQQIRRLPANDKFQLEAASLEKAIRDDREAGLIPFVVIATCGTTNCGAVDPLVDIAQVCSRKGLWMHVDGAYGASVCLSASRSSIAEGLGRADSISWDAHKWLFQTYSCGLILVKDKAHMLESFANDGDYLRDGTAIEDEDVPNFWNYSIELTRPASRAMKLWFTLRILGVDAVGRMVDHGFELAERAEVELRKLPDWEITSEASLAILTFRFAPKGKTSDELDTINSTISKELIRSNVAGILTTKLRGKVVLRICALSPQLGLKDIADIVKEIDRLARSLLIID